MPPGLSRGWLHSLLQDQDYLVPVLWWWVFLRTRRTGSFRLRVTIRFHPWISSRRPLALCRQPLANFLELHFDSGQFGLELGIG